MSKMTIKLMAQMALALVGGSALTACGSKDNNAAMMGQQAPEIATMTVDYGSSDLAHAYPATIKGRTDIAIRPQVTGFITQVHVDEGQRVRKGQPLFTLDQVQFQAAVDQAAAAVNVAKTQLESARLTANNKQRLFEKNIISEYENQLAKNDLANAQSQLANAQAALTTARKNMSYTVVTAPSDGVVGSIPMREGSLASPSMSQPLTTVSDNSDVYAYFSLNEKDILDMTDGGSKRLADQVAQMPPVKLRLADGTVYPLEGKVATVSGVLDAATGSASVRALFANPNGMLRSGSTGQILIPQVLDSVIVVPQKATFEIQDRRFIYVVGDSGVVRSQAVTVAPMSDGQNFVITSGLRPGDQIVVEGVGNSVREGMKIIPKAVTPEQPAAPVAE